jgi:ferredoxin-NADP reductase
LKSTGPVGQFYRFAPVHGKKLCFITGGSGITPFMSMLQNDAVRGDYDNEITLIYGCALELGIE